MRIRKTFLCLLPALALILTLAACGSKASSTARPPQLVSQAEALLTGGQYAEAENFLLKAQKASDFRESADFYHLLGLACYGKEEYSKAIVYYRQALSLAPERTDVLNNLGLAHLARNDFQQAVTDFSRALTDLGYPKPYLLRYNLALAYMKMGAYPEALMNLDRALEGSPALSQAYALKGRIYLKQKKYSQAISNLEQASRLASPGPEEAETLDYLAGAYKASGQGAKAREVLERAAAAAPQTR